MKLDSINGPETQSKVISEKEYFEYWSDEKWIWLVFVLNTRSYGWNVQANV